MSKGHKKLEKSITLMSIFIVVAISLGGLVEILPLIFSNQVNQPAEGVKPYPALQLAGRDVYVREGCYVCHSQMVRPFRSETERYGPYSVAGESVYDRPFQWGSKRTGPDLARLGNKYSNEWHVAHLIKPRDVVPDSIMPNYPWLMSDELDYSDIQDRMRALKIAGVPYSVTQEEYDANVAEFGEEVAMQLDILRAEENLMAQALANDYDGQRTRITEMDALVAYLQVLGTMVDFSKFDEGHFAEFR